MGFVHIKLNQIRNIDALSCTGCLLTQLLVNNITFPASIILHNPVCSLHKSSSSILKLLYRFQNIHYIVMGDWTDCKKCRWGSQKMRWKAGHPVLSHAENGGRELKYKKRPKGYSPVHRGSILNVKFWETVYGSICFSNCADHLREVLKKYGNLKWHLPWKGGGSPVPLTFFKNVFLKHLESFPDCQNVFCT